MNVNNKVEKDKIMENKEFQEEGIDLVWLFYALIKKAWLIILVAVVCACGMAAYTKFRIDPTYTSKATMLVLTKETTLTSLADLQLGTQLTKDYTILITSQPVLDEVIENLGLNMNHKSLKGRVSIENPEDTRILYVSVTLNDAKQAKAVVDELVNVSSAYIAEQMDITAPRIIEYGELTGTKTGPNMTKNAAMGFLAGALIVCAILVIMELLNDTIQTEDDVERYLSIPTLAVVPDKSEEQKKLRMEKGRSK